MAAILLAGAEDPATAWSTGRPVRAGGSWCGGDCRSAARRLRRHVVRLTAAAVANETLARQAERARISRHAFDHFQQVAADTAVFVINAQGLIVEWPESAARMYGYSAEQVLGSSASSNSRRIGTSCRSRRSVDDDGG